MAVREYNYTPGQDKISITDTATATAVSGGAANLGGTIGLRIILDDAVMTTREGAYLAIEIIRQRMLERNWPPA